MVLKLLALFIAVAKSAAESDCNDKPEDHTPGDCCEYGWSNKEGEAAYTNLYDETSTKASGKISCLQWVFPIHLFFTFALVILGIVNMALRSKCLQKYVWLHPWIGRTYILTLMGAMFSALLIHNEGLPLGVIVNFIIALVCLAIGWFAIVIEEHRMHQQALEAGCSNKETYIECKKSIWATKTLKQKFFSWYTLHGTMMFTSWFQFFGRFFYLIFLGSSYGHHYKNVGGDYTFTCYTYPMYKRGVKNFIFCNNTQTNDRWGDCSEDGYCPLLANNSSPMPWDPEDAGGLGLWMWVFLLVVIPFLLVALVFCCFIKGGSRTTSESGPPSETTPLVH